MCADHDTYSCWSEHERSSCFTEHDNIKTTRSLFRVPRISTTHKSFNQDLNFVLHRSRQYSNALKKRISCASDYMFRVLMNRFGDQRFPSESKSAPID